MKPVVVNGKVWQVLQVAPDDPLLIDRTGSLRLATTDPDTRTIRISRSVIPPLLDMVMLHEATHAITISYGLTDSLRALMTWDLQVFMEEWSAELLEKHGIEAAVIASRALGRPVCIRGFCLPWE